MITYYLIGNWMGSFRTKSTTESIDEFIAWKEKYDFQLDKETGIYKGTDGGRVVIESMTDDVKELLKNPKIGI
jgi:hypothetical protein